MEYMAQKADEQIEGALREQNEMYEYIFGLSKDELSTRRNQIEYNLNELREHGLGDSDSMREKFSLKREYDIILERYNDIKEMEKRIEDGNKRMAIFSIIWGIIFMPFIFIFNEKYISELFISWIFWVLIGLFLSPKIVNSKLYNKLFKKEKYNEDDWNELEGWTNDKPF